MGTGTQKGREGTIPVTGMHHKAHRWIDPGSGDPGKTVVHSELMIQKPIDSSTPLLREFHKTRAVLNPWVLRLVHMPKSGSEANYFTITLTGARVFKIVSHMPPLQQPANAQRHEHEMVYFDFESITWKEELVKATGGPTYQPGTASASTKIGKYILFDQDWQESNAKVAVMKIFDELKDFGSGYAGNLYANLVAKLTGKKPPVEPAADDAE